MPNKILSTFKRGTWTAHVLYRDPRLHYSGTMVRLDHPGGYLTSWPIQYDNGDIAYDSAMPKDAQRAAIAAYRWINQQKKSAISCNQKCRLSFIVP